MYNKCMQEKVERMNVLCRRHSRCMLCCTFTQKKSKTHTHNFSSLQPLFTYNFPLFQIFSEILRFFVLFVAIFLGLNVKRVLQFFHEQIIIIIFQLSVRPSVCFFYLLTRNLHLRFVVKACQSREHKKLFICFNLNLKQILKRVHC